jgi:hypothetical protein
MTLQLELAQELCETIVDPLPATARGVVLQVAGRMFSNVNSATQIGLGSAYASLGSTGAGGVGGLYLSRSEKATLRRLAGRTGAFSIDVLARGVSESQAVVVTASAGTFTLAFDGAVSDPIAFNVTPVVLQAALEGLSTIGAGNVSVASGFVVSFRNALAFRALPQLVADDSALTGTVAVATLTQGEPAVGGWC